MFKYFRKFFLTKEIISQQGVVHFRRWRVLQLPWFGLYYHQIFQSDIDRHCHNHPWHFCSLILSGGYLEYDPQDRAKRFEPGMINWHHAKDFHHLALFNTQTPTTTTLVFTFGRHREWGYSVNGSMIPHQEYRQLKRQGKL